MANRGQNPRDAKLFAAEHHSTLVTAGLHLQWLLSHNYALTASIKLVGDHLQLRQRQRLALGRAAASQQQVELRAAKQIASADMRDREVWIDTFNFLLTLEAYLGGGILLRCQDGTMRDMSSVHGTYRKVAQTEVVIAAAITWFHHILQVRSVRWLIDAPVSNSGRLRSMIEAGYVDEDFDREVALVPNPDFELCNCDEVVVSTDSVILDRCQQWSNAVAEMIDLPASPLLRCQTTESATIVDFGRN